MYYQSIDHNILLHKLNYYGINGAALDLCKNYLYNRKQYVEIGDFKSEEAAITTDVPQGSILGPLLFIIYINDIALSSDLFKFIIYAYPVYIIYTLSSTLNKFQSLDGQSQS